jgi:hypothetical protein
MVLLTGVEVLLRLLVGRGVVDCGGVEKEDLMKAIPWLEYRAVKFC